MKINEIAKYVKGEFSGNGDIEILGVGKIENSQKTDITFISNPLYEKYFSKTQAGAVLVSKDFSLENQNANTVVIKVQDPYLAFVSLLELFNKNQLNNYEGISDLCKIGENTNLGNNIYIDDFVKIGKNCKIGNGSKIFSNCSIGDNVEFGKNCTIESNVTIYKDCKFGNNVNIHSGTIIGSDGFGYAKQNDNTYKKIIQTGNVVIEDNVDIGSNCTIDRATIGETRICRGVKLDNQIQIAHNVYIGEDSIIVAQVGIAGSTKIGKRCIIGGQSGLVGHLTICDDVIIGAAVGVSKSITKPGIYTGYRAKPIKEDLKQEALIKYIEKLREEFKNFVNNK